MGVKFKENESLLSSPLHSQILQQEQQQRLNHQQNVHSLHSKDYLLSRRIQQDKGIDSGGNCRNITRSQTPAQASLGPLRSISWRSICNFLISDIHSNSNSSFSSSALSLSSSSRGTNILPAGVSLVDTLLFHNGVPMAYLYTANKYPNNNGHDKNKETTVHTNILASKPKDHLHLKKIAYDFHTIASSFHHENNDRNNKQFIASSMDENNTMTLMDDLSFQQTMNVSCVSPSIHTLSVFVHPKGLTSSQIDQVVKSHPSSPSVSYCNYRYEFKLDYKRAFPQEKFLRLNVSKDVISGQLQSSPQKQRNRGSTSCMEKRVNIKSMVGHINNRMGQSAHFLINSIESHTKCRVIQITVDFVETNNHTIANSSQQKNRHSDQPLSGSQLYIIRAFNCQVAPEITISSSKQDHKQLMKQTHHQRFRINQNLSMDIQRSLSKQQYCERDDQIFQTKSPLSSYNDQRQNQMNQKLLGSSQSEYHSDSCSGDFCSHSIKSFFIMSDIQSTDLSLENDIVKQKNLLSTKNQEDSSFSDFCHRLLHQERQEEGIRLVDSIEKQRLKSLSSSSPLIDYRGMHIQNREKSDKTKKNLYDIPRSVIAQARKEKHLIDRFLEIQKKGMKNKLPPPTLPSSSSHLSLGATYPGHYYQRVKVCEHCYFIYNLVEDARKKGPKQHQQQNSRKRAEMRDIKEKCISSVVSKRDKKSYNNKKDYSDNSSSPLHPRSFSSYPTFVKRAKAAICCIVKVDLIEISSFRNPPPAVNMVMSALSILLKLHSPSLITTHSTAAKTNQSHAESSDTLFNKMYELSSSIMGQGRIGTVPASSCEKHYCISTKQVNEVERYIQNPNFRPHIILDISKAAGKICGWIIAIVHLYKHQQTLSGTNSEEYKNFTHNLQMSDSVDPLYEYHQWLQTSSATNSGLMTKRSITKVRLRKDKEKQRKIATNVNEEEKFNPYKSQYDQKKAKLRKKAAIKNQQKRMEELNNKGGKSITGSAVDIKTLLCKDDITRIPYEVLGYPTSSKVDNQKGVINFVICHDFFDSIDMTRLLFRNLVIKYPGSQVLIYNQPGQAGTTYPRTSGEQSQTLNNEFQADKLHELLIHVDSTQEFPVSTYPFYIVGVGHGLSIALCFADYVFGITQQSTLSPRKTSPFLSMVTTTLKSIVSINGFASLDPQLTAILHSSSRLFQSFPINRPDLPVAYFSQYLFSDHYLTKVSKKLALNIYTAITNPITLDGRIRLLNGTLKNKCMKSIVQGLEIPIFVLHSTNNLLVQASNVDTLLHNKEVCRIVWSTELSSHQSSNINDESSVSRPGLKDYSENTFDRYKLELEKTQFGTNTSMAIFVSAGHALAQECKSVITDFFDSLCASSMTHFTLFNYSQHYSQSDEKTSMGDFTTMQDTECKNNSDKAEQSDKEFSIITSDKVELKNKITDANFEGDFHCGVDGIDNNNINGIDVVVQQESIKSNSSQSPVCDDVFYRDDRSHSDRTEHSGENFLWDCESTDESQYDVDKTPVMNQDFLEGKESAVRDPSDDLDAIGEKIIDDDKCLRQDLCTIDDATPEPSRTSWPRTGKRNMNEAEIKDSVSSKNSFRESSIESRTDKMIDSELLSTIRSPREYAKLPSIDNSYDPLDELDFEFKIKEKFMNKDQSLPDIENNSHLKESSLQEKGSKVDQISMLQLTDLDCTKSADLMNDTFAVSEINYTGTNLSNKDVQEKIYMNGDSKISQFGKNKENSTINIEDMFPEIFSPETFLSNPSKSQIKAHKWDIGVPPSAMDIELEAAQQLEQEIEREKRKIQEYERKKHERMKEESSPIQDQKFQMQKQKDDQEVQHQNNEKRIETYVKEDRKIMESIEKKHKKLEEERKLAAKELQRKLDIDEQEDTLVQKGVVPAYVPADANEPLPVRTLPPLVYDKPKELPSALRRKKLDSIFDELEGDAKKAKQLGILRIDEFERIQSKMAQEHLEKEKKLQMLEKSEQLEILTNKSIILQRFARGYLDRLRVSRKKEKLKLSILLVKATVYAQSYVRGWIGRRKARARREYEMMQLVHGGSACDIQRVWHGFKGRTAFQKEKRLQSTILLQRTTRGWFGRNVARIEREKLEYRHKLSKCAIIIQCSWRIKAAIERLKVLRAYKVAATDIQRVFRGFSGKKKTHMIRKWENAEPGPERIKLGLELLQDSKNQFEVQQQQIDLLHQAQERAESSVSKIYDEMKESEEKLKEIENELDEISNVEDEISQLVQNNMTTNQSSLKNLSESNPLYETSVIPEEGVNGENIDLHSTNNLLQIKRAEREKKKRHLESEFSLVYSEVERKRAALENLEIAITDIEETRQRKDREFQRLQRNLMELLQDQKFELDKLREKGVELETATAVSAAAAASTADIAREHEMQTSKMFNQQEELMKFQFMSMSLSYFSSLNMLKQMRGHTTNATASVLSNSADSAAVAAAAASAANIPVIGDIKGGKVVDKVERAISEKKAQLKQRLIEEKDAISSVKNAFPEDCRQWTIQDVSRWLHSLSLGMYTDKFEEARVDGEFLLELREEDLSSVLGVEHKLHRRKIMLSREKIRPLTDTERQQRNVLLYEKEAEKARKEAQIPSVSTVFSQARHGRLRRLQDSLEDGFNIDTKDESGNTVLMVAVQNAHHSMVDFLLKRGASVNSVNASGNTALHFAFAYDKTGQLGEFLIESGADDTIENYFGLTPYDGLGDDEQDSMIEE